MDPRGSIYKGGHPPGNPDPATLLQNLFFVLTILSITSCFLGGLKSQFYLISNFQYAFLFHSLHYFPNQNSRILLLVFSLYDVELSHAESGTGNTIVERIMEGRRQVTPSVTK